MKSTRHPLTMLEARDLPACVIGIDLCIEIVNTSGIAVASQALIRMRDAKSLVEGLMERAEEDLLREAKAPDAPPSYWLGSTLQAFGASTLADLFDAEEVADLEAIEVRSNGWSGSRWAVRVPIGEGRDGARHDDEIHLFLTKEAAADLCARARKAAQAVVEAAQPAKAVPTPAAEPRSWIIWTEERRALLRELYPTIMRVGDVRGALNALPGAEIPNNNRVSVEAAKLNIHRKGEPVPERFAHLLVTPQPPRANQPYSHERLALLAKHYPTDMDLDVLLGKLNKLPGPPIASVGGLRQKALEVGLKRPERGAATKAPPAAPEEDKPEARAMILAGKGAKDLVEEFGWDITIAQDFAEAVRADQQKDAA